LRPGVHRRPSEAERALTTGVHQIGPFCTLQAVDTEDAEADQNGGYGVES
jgi:hypothetical protein